MNKLKAKITGFECSENIAIINTDVSGSSLSSIVIENEETAPYLKIGNSIDLLFKETEVSLAKELSGFLSFRNRIKVRIKEINTGEVFSKITLDHQGTDIVSILTNTSLQSMDVKQGEEIEAIIKANEITISPE